MGKIILDKIKCIGCGNCVALCPKHFEMAEDGKPGLNGSKKNKEIEELETERIGCAKDAADSCPTQAIIIKN